MKLYATGNSRQDSRLLLKGMFLITSVDDGLRMLWQGADHFLFN